MSTVMMHVRVCQSECQYVMHCIHCMSTSMVILKRPGLIRCIISEGEGRGKREEGEGASSWLKHRFGHWGRSSWLQRSSRLEGERNGSTNALQSYFYLPSVCWAIQGSHLWKTMKIFGSGVVLGSKEKSQSWARSIFRSWSPRWAVDIQQMSTDRGNKQNKKEQREREIQHVYGTSSR